MFRALYLGDKRVGGQPSLAIFLKNPYDSLDDTGITE
jgi:hypothetical protein